MSDRTFERAVLDWLEDGSDRTSPAAIDAVLLAVKTTPQQRVLRSPWRFLPMPVLSRATAVAAVAVLAVVGAGGALLIANRPPGPGDPSPSPTLRTVVPTATIDLTGKVSDAIPITASGDDIWIGVNGAVIHVDGATNAETRIDIPSMQTGNGGLLKAPDGLWVADYRGNKLRRVNAASGAMEVEVDVAAPLGVFLIDDQVWVTSGVTHSAYRVDPATASLGPAIGDNVRTILSASDGKLWEARSGSAADADEVVVLDAANGSVNATITVPQGTGCDVNGIVPTNIWAGCTIFQLSDPAPRPIVRIDPETNTVVATVTVANFAGLVVAERIPWFMTLRPNGGRDATTLVGADPATGRIIALLDLGELSPDNPVVTSNALWIPDEQGKRVVKYDFADLLR